MFFWKQMKKEKKKKSQDLLNINCRSIKVDLNLYKLIKYIYLNLVIRHFHRFQFIKWHRIIFFLSK